MPFDKQFNKYFPHIKKAEEILKTVQGNKYKNGDIEHKETKVNVQNQNEEMIKYIRDTKFKLIQVILDKEKIKSG